VQDDWAIYVGSFAGGAGVPSRVPFQHEDIRAYIDTMFLDGALKPIERPEGANLPSWVRTGVIHDAKLDAVRRFRALRQKFSTEIPSLSFAVRGVREGQVLQNQ
jgi:hypothetical protein